MSTKERILRLVNYADGIIDHMEFVYDIQYLGDHACKRGLYFAQLYSIKADEMVTSVSRNLIPVPFTSIPPRCVLRLDDGRGWTCTREAAGTPSDDYSMCPAIHAAERLHTGTHTHMQGPRVSRGRSCPQDRYSP